MRRLFVCLLVVFFASQVVRADVRTDQRVKFQLGGALGKLVNFFGGKGAREGVTTVFAVKGDRKVMLSDTTGQIVDLAEEKVYDLDMKKKTYRVMTFEQIRAEMEKARKRAEEMAAQAKAEEAKQKPAEKDPDAPEMEVDFDVKNTGQTKVINGFNTSQTVVTITVREKGKTLQESGGLVLRNDLWQAKDAPSTQELFDFDRRYAQKLAGPMVVGASAQDMATALAMYPQIKPALEKMRAEGTKIEGTTILGSMTFQAVPPGVEPGSGGEQVQEAPAEKPKGGRFGGMLGGLGKMAGAGASKKEDSSSKPQPATIMTTSVETLKLTKDVTDDVVAIPAGFKESK